MRAVAIGLTNPSFQVTFLSHTLPLPQAHFWLGHIPKVGGFPTLIFWPFCPGSELTPLKKISKRTGGMATSVKQENLRSVPRTHVKKLYGCGIGL